ncbi:MAG: 50S ribosomal protein L24e [Candidatus Freyarchaeota archaeon]|nr:50S ribosomal protein L24e [Candidatus Jordarchaeia archaeon]
MKKYSCSFCGRDIAPGTGISYVRRDGVVLRFCSSKCRKNALNLSRKPRKFKWTEFYEKGG